MTLPIVGLLLVTGAFLGLTLYVFAPSNKAYYEELARIPLSETETDAERGASIDQTRVPE